MFTDQRRPDWTLYTQQGFNCNIWTASVDAAKRTVAAGMNPAFSLAPFVNPRGWAYRDYDQLEQRLKAIKASPYYEELLFVYWDNENAWSAWQPAVEAVARVRQIMPEIPIYVLQGNHGVARAPMPNDDYQMANAVGTYMSGDSGGAGGSGAGLILLDHTENQVSPVFFAQFNLGNRSSHAGQSLGGDCPGRKSHGVLAATYTVAIPVAISMCKRRPWRP